MTYLDKERLIEYLDNAKISWQSLRGTSTTRDTQLDAACKTIEFIVKGLDTFNIPVVQTTPTSPVKHRVRTRDEGTSWAAANSLTKKAMNEAYDVVYEALTILGPSTDEEIYNYSVSLGRNFKDSGLRTRRHELCLAGWVEKTSMKRRSSRNDQMGVYAAVPPK